MPKIHRKAEIAQEMLYSYGWAILILLAAIGTLNYFGVISPLVFRPDACTGTQGLACLESSATVSEIKLVLHNNHDDAITVTNLTIQSCTGSTSGIIHRGDSSTFSITGCAFAVGEKFDRPFLATYRKNSGLTSTVQGEVRDTAEI